MTNVTIGIVLIVVSIGLFVWLPPEGKTSSGPSSWGGGTVLPILIICLGIVGTIFVVRGVYP